MKISFVHIYMGDGKGKTSAAMGLALRAAGRGFSVKIVQFLKGRDTGEVFALKGIENIELLRVSDEKRFFYELSDEGKAKMREEVLAALGVIGNWLGKADVLVMDEALGAIECGILRTDEVLSIIENRKGTEIILTGRNAPKEIIGAADIVTQMKNVRHYFERGIIAREGIEY